MPCFQITSVWRGYHILIYYVIQCAHAYINPGVYKTHSFSVYQIPMGDTWITNSTAFRINKYSFENTIGSNINECDTLKMECYEIVTRF